MYLYINKKNGEVTKSSEWNMDYNYSEVTAIKLMIRGQYSSPYLRILNQVGEWKHINWVNVSDKV